MGTLSGPSLANAFLAHHEENWLDSCSLEYRPLYYRRYVDYTLALFKSFDHLKRFQSYFNSYLVNMSFVIETEQNNEISFLDVNVIREQCRFVISVYRKLISLSLFRSCKTRAKL